MSFLLQPQCCDHLSSTALFLLQANPPAPENAKYFIPDSAVHAINADLPPGCQRVSVPNCTADFQADRVRVAPG